MSLNLGIMLGFANRPPLTKVLEVTRLCYTCTMKLLSLPSVIMFSDIKMRLNMTISNPIFGESFPLK